MEEPFLMTFLKTLMLPDMLGERAEEFHFMWFRVASMTHFEFFFEFKVKIVFSQNCGYAKNDLKLFSFYSVFLWRIKS